VHPPRGRARYLTLVMAIAHCGQLLSGLGGVLRPGIVPRRDKDTTGPDGWSAKNDLRMIADRAIADHSISNATPRTDAARLYCLRLGRAWPPRGPVDAPI